MATKQSGSRRGQTGKGVARIQSFLKGQDYPCDRDSLMETAQKNRAPDWLMDMLEDIGDYEFGGPNEVMHALFHDVGEQDDDEDDRGGRSSGRQQSSGGNGGGRATRSDVGSNGRASSNGRSQSSQGNGGGRATRDDINDDPDPGRVSSRRRVSDEEIEEARQRYEELQRQREEEGDSDGDRRLAQFQTDAIADARHMRHGYDGRGRVRKLGDGRVDERIEDDRERYEENQARQRDEAPVDPETGSHSRRRKDDEGRPLKQYRYAMERYEEEQGRGNNNRR